MEFRILGPLEAVEDGRTVALGPSKQRALLAVLLLHVNEVISRDRLIEDLWGERAPETAAASLHTYVSKLRRVLEPGNVAEPQVLITRAPGYLLEVDPAQVDLQRFELLAARGKRELVAGEPTAAATLAEALSLWRGSPLYEFGSAPFVLAESRRLQELWISTVEDRIDADLSVGRHRDVVAELDALVAKHPYRERLCGQFMVALYRSGRQAEALDVYRRTRRRLVEELGLEPGRELQALEHSILSHDPELQAASRAAPGPPARRGPRKPRPWLIAAALVVLAVGVASALTVLLARNPPPSIRLRANSVGFVDAGSGRVTTSYPVGRQPKALTVADRAVWVANYEDGTVTRIDPPTGRTVTIAVGGHPVAIAEHRGMLWVWTQEGLLVPIDPRYEQAGRPIRLAQPAAAGTDLGRVAAGGGFVWVTVPEASLLRVDPAHPDQRDTITPDLGAEGSMVERNGRMWVAGSGFAASVFPVVERTREVGTGIPVGGPIQDLAVDGDTLWVLSGSPVLELPRPRLRAVDIHDQLLRATVTVGEDPVAVAAGAGSIWVASRRDRTISRVDPSPGRVVETIKLGARPAALAGDRHGVWVAVG
jgi:DNA-binding SARP family transcriptional activator/streptogramin lyase